MDRRNFLQQAGLLTGAILSTSIVKVTEKTNPTILIVSGWQDVNIGDIAHTPGLIGLIKQRLPKVNIILWKKNKSEIVDKMLERHYPEVRIIHGSVSDDTPQSEAVREAFQEADFFIHGSGPAVLAADYLQAWAAQTTKPFGIFGVTIQEINPELKSILQKATFIFTRETASIAVLKKNGIEGEFIRFAPDATFALEIHDDAKAKSYMKANDLEARKFICVIPRLRITPYNKIRTGKTKWSEERIKEVNAINDKYKEEDHAKVREAMIAWVRQTGNKIVVCPEMTYQVDIIDELLVNPLPEDVKPFIVKHGYWLPDEAASLYRDAHTILSLECHSPIIAIANGTPAFYIRQPEDTIKGQMYYDLGLKDWTFEVMQTTGKQITDRLMQVYNDYPSAKKNVHLALERVEKQYDGAFKTLVSEVLKTQSKNYFS
ncbi:polysaccharide pyruvyl transferase family protein [Dyadobacter sp. NIV53]|uniref:polysaccharide pyruvyl transferase family protein n=1 Tax=Dyadobacter sp. NIV53 TaxID=2861765 RepID=UPI001C884C71|nr:polysaccharide pyruvyl transferase family protein [Dyadobacter sp. NIV53]